MFRNILKQQAEQRGKLIVMANKWFPSSQLCHVCGEQHKETKDLSVRKWTCPTCGAVHDRDVNAARNLTLLYLFNKSTGAAPGSYPGGEGTSGFQRWLRLKWLRRNQKNCRTGSYKPLALAKGS